MESNGQNNLYSWSIFLECFRRFEISGIDWWNGGGYAGSLIHPSFSRHVIYGSIDNGYVYHLWKYLVAPCRIDCLISRFMFDFVHCFCGLCVFLIGKLEKYGLIRQKQCTLFNCILAILKSLDIWYFIETYYIHGTLYGLEAPSANIE